MDYHWMEPSGQVRHLQLKREAKPKILFLRHLPILFVRP